MSKIVLLACFLVLGLSQTWAQTQYSQTDSLGLDQQPDTLFFNFAATPLVAYGQGELTCYFVGDFGDPNEVFIIYSPNGSPIGTSTNSQDCGGVDSVRFQIPADSINAWASGGSIQLYAITSVDVDLFCTEQYIKAKLSYFHCPAGSPLASLGSLPRSLCQSASAISLTGSPAGGSFTGAGVSGSSFNPQNLNPGRYTIRYTSNSGGCSSFATGSIEVLAAPRSNNSFACPGGTASLSASGGGNAFAWYDASGNFLAQGQTFTTPNLNASAQYQVRNLDSVFTVSVNDLLATNAMVVDHDNLSGDDNGGMAITQNYIYYTGDNNTVRYDLNLAGGVALPKKNSFFSDLGTGSLWELYDGNAEFQPYNSYFVNSLRGLDESLQPNGRLISLSRTIEVSTQNNNGGIFAGSGIMVLFNGHDNSWYAINLSNGQVDSLGQLNSPDFYGTENWATWGVAERNSGGGYEVLYRSNMGPVIMRRNLPAGTPSTVASFTNLSDMDCFTLSPWNNRWYFHYEGNGQFGGTSETLGYADADLNSGLDTVLIGSCASPVEVRVSRLDLGVDTSICQGQAYPLFAGLGFTSYTWNGDNNNFNVIFPDSTGQYEVVVTDVYGCTLSDAVNITVNVCTGLNASESLSSTVFPNPSQGLFRLQFAQVVDSDWQLLDATGRVLRSGQVQGQQLDLDLSALAKGLYLLQGRAGTALWQHKLILVD